MGIYDIRFSIKLAEVAQSIELNSYEARRTVVYLSRLSMELSLKAFLEQAGRPVAEIKSYSHDIRKLLIEVGKFEVKAKNSRMWHSAAHLRTVTISFQHNEIPVGWVLDAEDQGASVYPNEIRYGEEVQDFPPEVLALVAEKVAAWIHEHSTSVRYIYPNMQISIQ